MDCKDRSMTYPKRTSEITNIKHTSFQGSGKPMYGIFVEMKNGDNFSSYNSDERTYKGLKEGDSLEYILTNSRDGKSRAKIIIEMKDSRALISQLDGTTIDSLLFIDIETVRGKKTFPKKGTPIYDSWAYKMRKEEVKTAKALKESYESTAPLFAEFGSIVCISIGMVRNGEIYTQSYYGEEKELLTNFVKALNALKKSKPNLRLCGYTIQGFDLPYIFKRLLINGMRIPQFLNVANSKPWELWEKYVDIALLWRTLEFRYASLINVTTALGLPSPKQGIDGSQVSDVFYKGGINEIVEYCERDVFATVNIMEHLYNLDVSEKFISKTFG